MQKFWLNFSFTPVDNVSEDVLPGFFYQFFTFEKPAFGTASIHFTENKRLA